MSFFLIQYDFWEVTYVYVIESLSVSSEKLLQPHMNDFKFHYYFFLLFWINI